MSTMLLLECYAKCVYIYTFIGFVIVFCFVFILFCLWSGDSVHKIGKMLSQYTHMPRSVSLNNWQHCMGSALVYIFLHNFYTLDVSRPQVITNHFSLKFDILRLILAIMFGSLTKEKMNLCDGDAIYVFLHVCVLIRVYARACVWHRDF